MVITQGHEERQRFRAKRREADEIRAFLGGLQGRIASAAAPLFATPLNVAAAQAASFEVFILISQTRDYAEQVARFAEYLDFASRVHISSLVAYSAVAADAMCKVNTDADELSGTPNWSFARHNATEIQNAIELAKL